MAAGSDAVIISSIRTRGESLMRDRREQQGSEVRGYNGVMAAG